MSADLAKVAEFRKHCNQIVQGDDGGKSLKALEKLIEKDMAKEYKIPVHTVLPGFGMAKAMEEKQLRGLWHQLTQHLVDLGYITEGQFRSYLKNKKTILRNEKLLAPIIAGIKIYLQEETENSIRNLVETSMPEDGLSRIWIEQHMGMIVEAISTYTSFDGSLSPPENYRVGEVSCYGRSLAFRIRVIFEMDETLKNVYIFDRSMVKFTASLSQILDKETDFWLADKEDEDVTISDDFWLLTCNIDQLFEDFFAALPKHVHGKALAISYQYDKFTEEAEEKITLKKIKLVYLERPAKGNPKWYNNNKRLKKGIKSLDEGIYAVIAFRLLQLKLWQTSFYQGEIDGKWGLMSHAALFKAQDQELDLIKDDLQKKKVKKRPINRRRKMVERAVFHDAEHKQVVADLEDMHEILKGYVSAQTEKDSAGENEMILIQELRANENIDDQELDKAILNEKDLDSCYATAGASSRRRVSYVSLRNRSFFQWLRRGIKKIVGWIINQFKKIFGLIFSFAKVIIDRIRKGFQLFAKGFQYFSHLLLGRPIFAPRKSPEDPLPRIFTRFQLDFDAINYIPKNATSDELKAHGNTLDMMHRSMMYFIDVILFVIKMISKLTRPGGWVWLGITIFKWLFRRIEELFQPVPQHQWSEEEVA